jgi:hypothetical protein
MKTHYISHPMAISLPLAWNGSSWQIHSRAANQEILRDMRDISCRLHRCWTPFGERALLVCAVRDDRQRFVVHGSSLSEPGYVSWPAITEIMRTGRVTLRWTHDPDLATDVPVTCGEPVGPPQVAPRDHMRTSVPNPLHRSMPMFLPDDQPPAPTLADDDLRQQIALHALAEELGWREELRTLPGWTPAATMTDPILAAYAAYAAGSTDLSGLLTRRWTWLQADDADAQVRRAVRLAESPDLTRLHALLVHDASLAHATRVLTGRDIRLSSPLLPWVDLRPLARVAPERTRLDLLRDWAGFDAQAITARLFLGEPALQVLRDHLEHHPLHDLTHDGMAFRDHWRRDGSMSPPADTLRKAGATLLHDALAHRHYAIEAGSVVELPDPVVPRLHLTEIPDGAVAILEGHPIHGRTPISIMQITWSSDGAMVEHAWSIDVDDAEVDAHYQTVIAAVVRDLMVLELRERLDGRRAGFVLRQLRRDTRPLYVYLARRHVEGRSGGSDGSCNAPPDADPDEAVPASAVRGLAATNDAVLRLDGVLLSPYIRPHLHRLPCGHQRSPAADAFIRAHVPWVPSTATFNRGTTVEAADAAVQAPERLRIFRSRSATACIVERLGLLYQGLLQTLPDRHQIEPRDWRIDQQMIGTLMREAGVDAVRIRPHPDGGIDLDGRIGRIPVLVQVKSGRKVDWPAVLREFAGALQREESPRIAILVSCGQVPTPDAVTTGGIAGIRVCHLIDLPRVLGDAIRRLAPDATATSSAPGSP